MGCVRAVYSFLSWGLGEEGKIGGWKGGVGGTRECEARGRAR